MSPLGRLSDTFGGIPSGYDPQFSPQLSEEQSRRTLILRTVLDVVAAERSTGDLIELTRYLETGLRSFEDPPGIALAAQGTDPDVIDAEKIRTAVETTLANHGYDASPFSSGIAKQIVELVIPGVSS